jgi:hypothetical protein
MGAFMRFWGVKNAKDVYGDTMKAHKKGDLQKIMHLRVPQIEPDYADANSISTTYKELKNDERYA